jgi:DNA-binding NtrC family response regulator
VANILIVDDERSICELLEITFRKDGHRVEIATGGEAARRSLESKIFDIIISDIRMPDMSGVDLLQYAKEVSPSTVFLLITGVPTVETAIAAINAGADRYVIKDHELVTNCAARLARWMRICGSKTKPVICAENCGGSPARTILLAEVPRCARFST